MKAPTKPTKWRTNPFLDDVVPTVRRFKSRVTRTDSNDPAKATAVDKILEKYKQRQAY